ncbi:MAG: prolipoprotein diacylglyceryl transferase [Nitrospinota bacterium]
MSPILFQFGPFTIRYYGLMYVLAVLVGVYILNREVRRVNLPLTGDDIMNFALLVMLFGILGGRLYYVAFNWDFYGRHPLQIPAVWRGGLAIHGGLIGGVAAGIYFTRRKGIPTWKFADLVAPTIILGQAFGRFGNFMNGDAHGAPTALPWGIVFPPQSIAGRQFPGQPLHPTMLYELTLNLIFFGVLWKLRTRPHRDGFIFCLYLILYSVGRFFVSFFRADSLMLGPFRAAHLASVLLVALGLFFILRGRLWAAEASGRA